MTHYRLLDRAPSVSITSKRNELKLYQGNIVYLNDGDNFELRFFNPLQEKLGVEIIFNGVKKGNGYLVLNPGQDLILDRFLDEQRKMIFETYNIDGNNEAAVKAIEKNGLITFNFYKEANSYRSYNDSNQINVNYNFPPKPYRPNTTNIYNTTNNYYSNTGTSGWSGTSGSSGVSGLSGSSGVSGSPGPRGTSTTGGIGGSPGPIGTYGRPGIYINEIDHSFNLGNVNGMGAGAIKSTISTTSTFTSSTNYSEYIAENLDKNIDFSDYLAEDSLETGRIEMGDLSNQKLKAVNAQFAMNPFHTISYQILPYSQMNRTIGEVRNYCIDCGYRIRKENWKFCPKCGSKLH